MIMNKKVFKNKKEEADFYDNLDYGQYLKGLKEVKLDDSNIIPTSKSISLRLPIKLIQKLKLQANSMDIPYQSLIKMYVKEGADNKTNTQKKL